MKICLKFSSIIVFKLQSSILQQSTPLLGTKIFEYSCTLMVAQTCFVLELKLLVAEPPHSSTIFFEAAVTDQDSRELMKFKFGFRLEANKEQYRIVENNDYIIQTLFSCLSIERNYQPPPQTDNTIYGMSFIDVQEIQFEVNEDPSARHIFVDISLSNQYQKLYLERVEGTNICRNELSSVFFIQRSSIAELTIIEEGVLSNSVLGNASVTFSQTFITKQKVSIHCEVVKDRKIIGKLTLKYSNLKEISFIDVNMFTYISRTNAAMVAELQEFGPSKQKNQKLTLTSRGEDVTRLQSEDSFIVTKDPREYQITVNERDTNKLLGEFKLCHELQAVGERITVLQPLRTSMNTLNGVLVIEYVSKRSNTITWEQNNDKQTLLVDLSVQRLTLKKHYSRLTDNFAVRLRTALRQNKTKMAQIGQPSNESFASFTICNNQSCEIALLDKTDLIGAANISPPYFQNEQRVIVLTKDSKSVAIFTLKTSYLKSEDKYGKMREISSIQASNLTDTETFSKITPFIELQSMGKRTSFATELGLGKQKIFWKVNLITADAMKLTVKDKDMFFDDLIGSAVLDPVEKLQSQDKIQELTLVNQQQGKKEGNGILKVTTSPVTAKFDIQSISTANAKEVKCYMLQLGGIVKNELLKTADCIEISLGSADGRVALLKQMYDDLYFYLSNKDIEVQLDSYFTGNSKEDLQIFISLYEKNNIIYEQIISNKNKKQQKDIFTIYNFIPLQREFYYFEKIYLWMMQKIPPNLQIYLASQGHYEKLRIATYQKYLIVLQPNQLCFSFNLAHPLTLILRQGTDTFLQFNLTLSQNTKECKYIANGGIVSNKAKEIGFYYAEISKFVSKGERQERRTIIGKSQRKWVNVCICEAVLTKDLEIFSKMDPYCKFGPANKRQAWIKTKVQENIGLHPIWNQSFFIELVEGESQQLGFAVMDEEVAADRAIGEGKMAVRQLLGGDVKEVELLYKCDEPSGKLRVQAVLTSTYIIFRNRSSADEDCHAYLFHQANREGDAGVKIQLGVAYVVDVRREIKIKVKNTVKSLSFTALKEQQLNGVTFEQQCAWLHYDIYE